MSLRVTKAVHKLRKLIVISKSGRERRFVVHLRIRNIYNQDCCKRVQPCLKTELDVCFLFLYRNQKQT